MSVYGYSKRSIIFCHMKFEVKNFYKQCKCCTGNIVKHPVSCLVYPRTRHSCIRKARDRSTCKTNQRPSQSQKQTTRSSFYPYRKDSSWSSKQLRDDHRLVFEHLWFVCISGIKTYNIFLGKFTISSLDKEYEGLK